MAPALVTRLSKGYRNWRLASPLPFHSTAASGATATRDIRRLNSEVQMTTATGLMAMSTDPLEGYTKTKTEHQEHAPDTPPTMARSALAATP